MAQFSGCGVGVLAQHQSHTASHTRRCHGSTALKCIAIITAIVSRLDANTRGAHIGTNKSKLCRTTRREKIVGIITTRPITRALRRESGCLVGRIDGTYAYRATQTAWVQLLVGVEIGRWATSRQSYVIRDGIL